MNKAPEPKITAPEANAIVVQGQPFEAAGQVEDEYPQDVLTTWCVGEGGEAEAGDSSQDSTADTDEWCGAGTPFCQDEPLTDDQVHATYCNLVLEGFLEQEKVPVSLWASDGTKSGGASVTVVVSVGDDPVVTITSPVEGEVFRVGELISFQGKVADTEPLTGHTASWTVGSDCKEGQEIAGVDDQIDSSGNVGGTGVLGTPGEQQVCLVVRDPAENEASDQVIIVVEPPNSPPTCTITNPATGTTASNTQVIQFEAQVDDPDESSMVNLNVTWYSSLVSAPLGTSRPSAAGDVAFPFQLDVGTHAITCEVTDPEGEVGSDSIELLVGQGPLVEILDPENLATYCPDESIYFYGIFDDPIYGASPLSVAWEDNETTLLYDGWTPGESSFLHAFDAFDLGDHRITFTVVNPAGYLGADEVFLTISDDRRTWYLDLDGDGFGDPLGSIEACGSTGPTGYTTTGEDCDDSSSSAYPGAPETCNGLDDNCNGAVDEGSTPTTWYRDTDGDGYGDPAVSMESCGAMSGWVSNNADCDDTSPAAAAVNPAAAELCDGADNDCDGLTDEGFTYPPGTLWYRDGDKDGYGIETASMEACEPPDGYVNNAFDCDDADSASNPGMPEQCNEKDDDCDAVVDEPDFPGVPTWYSDGDGDGYGVTSDTVLACSAPTGYAPLSGDCDDGDIKIYPAAPEACDGIDNDCDSVVDDGFTYPATTPWYRDVDSDGFGTSVDPPLFDCEPLPGFVSNAVDCDDGNALASPARSERCATDFDDDCDGQVNESDAVDVPTWYQDSDADGYGETSTAMVQCENPGGYVEQWGDCDDAVGDSHPGAAEVCDAADNDCDGSVDEGFPYPYGTVLYQDLDGDGYGTAAVTTEGCDAVERWSPTPGDCDDASDFANPGLPEVCDDADNDCDTQVDEPDAVDAPTWYTDADMDGYGDTTTAVVACDRPSGGILEWGDCDDGNAAVNPATPEICDGADQNCNGVVDDGFPFPWGTLWYHDADGDGYGTEGGPRYDCVGPDGYSIVAGDCNDDASDVNPGQVDLCDGVDNNCDGVPDEENEFTPTWYYDEDGDGYGLTDLFVIDCTPTAEYASEPGDCDDEAADINPGMDEVCDGLDNDCGDDIDEDFPYPNGTTWYLDADGDGYGLTGAAWPDCEYHEGYVVLGGDCDDANAAVNPLAADVCDSVDNNCDGEVDEVNDLTPTWYVDADADGYGDLSTATRACMAPAGSISTWGDCDDESAGVNPRASESCDGVDNDCDTFVDEFDSLGATTWYSDADGDGFGNASASQVACDAPSGYVSDATDCDDYAASAHPGGVEVCDSTDTDEDCDGVADDEDVGATGTRVWYQDSDGDGFGTAYKTTSACDSPVGYASNSLDCDDGASGYYINPAATESCDEVDNDCDGKVDDDDSSVTGTSTWYQDYDSDTYGNCSKSQKACEAPSRYVSGCGDCDDGTSAVRPGATEATGDGVDQDCDGLETCYLDWDDDGYRTTSTVTSTDSDCKDSHEALATDDAGDCDDYEADANPDETEVCDGIDNDCDGAEDETGASGCTTWYYDKDGDGHGREGYSGSCMCSSSGYYRATVADDCDDNEADANPDETEVCDGTDNDCDASVDDGCSIVDLVFTDDDNNLGCPSVQTVGAGSAENVALSEGECHALGALKNRAAQVDAIPTVSCVSSRVYVTLYKASGSCGSGTASYTYSVACTDTYEALNLNCVDTDGDGHGDYNDEVESVCASDSATGCP